jgi:hypothetical protein
VLLELLNSVADDVYTFSRLGLLGGRIGERAGKCADWCWLASTLVNLVENSVERSVLRDLQHEGTTEASENMRGYAYFSLIQWKVGRTPNL